MRTRQQDEISHTETESCAGPTSEPERENKGKTWGQHEEMDNGIKTAIPGYTSTTILITTPTAHCQSQGLGDRCFFLCPRAIRAYELFNEPFQLSSVYRLVVWVARKRVPNCIANLGRRGCDTRERRGARVELVMTIVVVRVFGGLSDARHSKAIVGPGESRDACACRASVKI